MISPELNYLVQRALMTRHELPPRDQMRILQGIVQLCPEGSSDAETATQAIYHLQRAEHEQLRLDRLFSK